MRLVIIAFLTVLVSASVLVAFVPVVQETSDTIKFCHPSHSAVNDGGVQCGRPGNSSCLTGNGKDGCKDGERMEETNICSAYCHKEKCTCCKVLRTLPPPKKKP